MTTPGSGTPDVLFDLTTTTHAQGRSGGLARVESRLGEALLRAHPAHVTPVSWSAGTERLLALTPDTARDYFASGHGRLSDPSGSPLCEQAPSGGRRILLVTGSGWLSNVAFLHGLLRARRELRAELHVVIHDLIHSLFPHWTPGDDSAKFRSHLELMIASADRLLVYSRSTARDLASLVRRQGLRPRDIRDIVLGTEFADGHAPADAPSPEAAAIAAEPFVLYVSTVTIRKNHEFLCHVWARLADELGRTLPRLVLAGRVASDQELVMERLALDPGLRDHLVRAPRLTDADLAWLYSRCLFTVFPSLYEGWGLPVAESLAFGKACLTSNASAVPEAAAGLMPGLDPRDFRAWAEAIRTLVLDPGARAALERRIRTAYRPVGWTTAAARLWDAIIAPPASCGSRPCGSPGHGNGASTTSGGRGLMTPEPWSPVRSALGVVVASQTRLALPLDGLPRHGVRLELSFDSAGPGETRLEVEVNGLIADGSIVPAGTRGHVRKIDVPRDTLLRRAFVELQVTAGPVDGPAGPAWSAPVRLAGVRVAALSADAEQRAIGDQCLRWRLGETLLFSAGSPARSQLGAGWGDPAHWGVWTTEPTAQWRFRPMPQPGGPVRLRVAARAFVWPAHPSLAVDVQAGGRLLATWAFRHPADTGLVERHVDLPPDVAVDGIVDLTLAIPDCRSPRMLGLSGDERRLGVGLVKAQCAPVAGLAGDPDWLRRGRGGGAGW